MSVVEMVEYALRLGWPKAKLVWRINRLCAYYRKHLVAEIAVYTSAKWIFVHYGYGGFGGHDIPIAAIKTLGASLKGIGWSMTVKGGNPLLEGKEETKNLRDFIIPDNDDLLKLRKLVQNYFSANYPEAKIVEMVIYGGMAWHLVTEGNDALGIRDIDINVFLKYGGPRNLRWTVNVPFELNGVARTVDLFWNVLPPQGTVKRYMEEKIRTAKRGRWLTIPDRPWVSLLSGKVIWSGRM